MLNEIDQLAVDERRTRSDLMRQAIREYMERKQDRQAVLLQAQLAHAGVA
jgi:predicted transcriptional regulator